MQANTCRSWSEGWTLKDMSEVKFKYGLKQSVLATEETTNLNQYYKGNLYFDFLLNYFAFVLYLSVCLSALCYTYGMINGNERS